MSTSRIATAQTFEFREDLEGALALLGEVTTRAERAGASLLCLPEGFLQGYLTDEGSARRNALDVRSDAFRAVLDCLPQSGPTVVFGMIEVEEARLFNTALVARRGVLLGRYRKAHLLAREGAFEAGDTSSVFEVDGLRFGINICHDTNFPEAAKRARDLGADLLVCLANNMLPRASAQKWKDVHNAVRGERCRETGMWLVSSDVTGERDGMAAWGPTAVLDPTGEVVAQLPLKEPGLLVYDLPI